MPTSLCEQVKELTHKLEQVAKQQQVEEEMVELKKQQTKIAELRQRVGKLTTKCQLWYTHTNEDKVQDMHMLQVAALFLELADRLAAQVLHFTFPFTCIKLLGILCLRWDPP